MPDNRVTEIRNFLEQYHPLLIEGPGPSDSRPAEAVASRVAFNVKKHVEKYHSNNEKPLLLIAQGDPPNKAGISAVGNLVAAGFGIDKCVVCLDEDINPNHCKNADKERCVFEIKYNELVQILDEESEGDDVYTNIVDDVEKKLEEYKSQNWVEQYAKLQEITKVAMKKICGGVTVAHTVADPDNYSVTRFCSVGLSLDLIDEEEEMVKYNDDDSCELN